MMAEELLLYVVPVVVVLATCLLLYLCSVRPGQVNQPDFAILSAQQQKSSKQAAALAAEEHHHSGADGRYAGKGSTRLSMNALNGGNTTVKASNKLSGMSGTQQYGSRNKRIVETASTTSGGGFSKQQRKLPVDSHENNNRRRDKQSIGTDLELKSSDTQTDRSSGINSVAYGGIADNNDAVVQDRQPQVAAVESVKELSAELANDDDYFADIPVASRSSRISDDDDEGISIPVSMANAQAGTYRSPGITGMANNSLDNSSHQRKPAATKHAHAAAVPPSSPYASTVAQQHRVKRYDNNHTAPHYSQQKHCSGSSTRTNNQQHAGAGDSNGWKGRDLNATGGGNSLVFVNSKQQQQLRANGPTTSVARGPSEKQNAAWNGDFGKGNHGYYSGVDSSSSSLASGRKPPSYNHQQQQSGQRQQYTFGTTPTPRQFNQPQSTVEPQQKEATIISNNNFSTHKNNDFPNTISTSPATKPREHATIYQHKFSGLEHINNMDNHIAGVDEQVQTDECLAEWIPVILDAIFAEATKCDDVSDDEDENNDAEDRDVTLPATTTTADKSESSCQTVLACGYVEHAQIDPALSGLVIINQGDGSGQNFSGEHGNGRKLLISESAAH